ncbi:hypothetical protein [Vibrio algivorus]|uniref:Uncharacterized protein n=1 Tax=Vibrio algivorus TaxID=1667024 RepID=A0A557NV42_9VIBR|nr:hypothetical protein [Vibrio algivorus]TVO32296.1 hypothetical protein FOF44_17100 [Vibrio algivorus]
MAWSNAFLISVDRVYRDYFISSVSRFQVTSKMERIYPMDLERLFVLDVSYAQDVSRLLDSGEVVLRLID